MAPANNRQEAADQFWSDVEDPLEQKYGHPAAEARRGIDEYQREVNDRNSAMRSTTRVRNRPPGRSTR